MFYAQYPVGNGGGGGGGGVTSLNALTGALTLVAGAGITVTPAAPNITIASTIGAPFQEIPTGAINGVNVTFTLGTAPTSLAAFELFLDGLLLRPITDYSVAGTTITMVTAPNFGQFLYAVYTVVSGGAGIITAISDTASIDLTNTLGTLTADVNVPFLIDVSDSRGTPGAITAGGGIPFAGNAIDNLMFVEGSGGPVTITANPKIAAGSFAGQKLELIFTSNVNTITITDGTGVNQNGTIVGNANSAISYVWDGSAWFEMSRRS